VRQGARKGGDFGRLFWQQVTCMAQKTQAGVRVGRFGLLIRPGQRTAYASLQGGREGRSGCHPP